MLLTTAPPLTGEDNNDASDFKLLYFATKSHFATVEALGINSVLIIQSRILVTLFEIAHGFYPAAYISLGSTVRAADALEIPRSLDVLHRHTLDTQPTQEDRVLIWCGILVLDR
jgi:hypothetical protein